MFILPIGWFLVPLFSLDSPRLSPTGPEGVYIVNRVRFSNMFTPLSLRFLFLLDRSVTFTWTWLDLFLISEGLLISSPSWTGPPVGQRLFPCPQPPLRIVLESWFPVGSPGLVFQPRLRLTMELNSPPLFPSEHFLFPDYQFPSSV